MLRPSLSRCGQTLLWRSASSSSSSSSSSLPPPTAVKPSVVNEDPITHTGQHWDKDDYRLLRFTHAPKQVNPNWAINLIAEVPPKVTKERVVWCDGGSGPEGHPRVYLNLDKPGTHSCGYCGLRFVKEDHH